MGLGGFAEKRNSETMAQTYLFYMYQKFLGSSGLLQNFVEGFSSMTSPLTKLTSEGSDGYVVYFDASRVVLGFVLMQQGKENVVANALRRLSMGSIALFDEQIKELVKDVQSLARLGVPRRCTAIYGKFLLWNGIKRDIEDFISKCRNCQQLKVENKKLRDMNTEIYKPTWKWETRQMTNSSLFLADKTTNSAKEYTKLYIDDIVRDRLKTIQSRHMSNAVVRRKKQEFQMDDWVFLKMSPMKGLVRFRKNGKINPRYVGPYSIFNRVGKVAHKLEFPVQLTLVRPTFHISLLKKCVGDPATIVSLESAAVKDSLSYENVPVDMLNLQFRRLTNKEVVSVKVLWRIQSIKGANSEVEASIKSKYPHLFPYDSTPA
ncbi:uncharacterized protein [Solanum lycopersicum]|uniref:uncharacterized protein n=1 Tax=Solanum lycopersicum TaxID=4081 RepID=UPI0037492782